MDVLFSISNFVYSMSTANLILLYQREWIFQGWITLFDTHQKFIDVYQKIMSSFSIRINLWKN